MVFGVGDELDITVSANTASFTTGMSRAESATEELRRDLQRLGFVTDRAEGDVDSLGRSAATTAGFLGGMGLSAEAAGFSIHGLSASIIGALVPAVVTLTAALTPVVAALGGLVTIGAAIGGIGLAGTLGAIATNTEMLRSAFEFLQAQVLDAFGPAFDMAANVLTVLLFELAEVADQLAPTEATLSQLGAAFLALGSAVIDTLPAFAELATALAVEFLPPFVEFAEDFLPQVPGMLRTLVAAARDVLPMFMDFGRSLRRLLPELMDFGMVALPIITDALGALNGFLIDTLAFVNQLESGFTSLVAGGSLVLPFLVGLVSLLGGPVTLALGATVAAVVGLANAFQNNFASIQTFARQLRDQFQTILPTIQAAFDAFISGVNLDQITGAVGDLEDALGQQLMVTLEALQPVFDDFQTLLEDNKEEFRLIGSVVGDIFSGVIRLGALLVNVLGPAFRTVVVPALRTFVDAADLVLTIIGDVIEATQELAAGNLEAAAQVGVESTAPSEFASLVAGPGRTIGQEQLQQQIDLALSGELVMGDDGELRAVIDEQVEANERQAALRARRNSGRPTR